MKILMLNIIIKQKYIEKFLDQNSVPFIIHFTTFMKGTEKKEKNFNLEFENQHSWESLFWLYLFTC